MARISEWYEYDKYSIFVSFVHSDRIRVTPISLYGQRDCHDLQERQGLQERQCLNKNSGVSQRQHLLESIVH
jgi:hypothetical protein